MIPVCLLALWENGKYHDCSRGGGGHNGNFHIPVRSSIGQHFGEKISLLPTAGASNDAFRGFTPALPPDAGIV